MVHSWRSRVAAVLAVLSLAAAAGAQKKDASAQKKEAKAAPLQLKVGQMAPDFTLLSFDGEKLNKVSLHDFRGKKNVVLAFYVFAFTGG